MTRLEQLERMVEALREGLEHDDALGALNEADRIADEPTEECRHCDPHSVLAIQDAQIAALRERLLLIGGIAHDASTGPTVPDTYWEIRRLVEEIL